MWVYLIYKSYPEIILLVKAISYRGIQNSGDGVLGIVRNKCRQIVGAVLLVNVAHDTDIQIKKSIQRDCRDRSDISMETRIQMKIVPVGFCSRGFTSGSL